MIDVILIAANIAAILSVVLMAYYFEHYEGDDF